MPSAFDRSVPSSEHDPLRNQLAFDPSKPLVSLQTLLDAWQYALDEFVFPIIYDLTGIDLSSPEAFFSSIAVKIIEGGVAITQFIKAVLTPLVNILVSVLDSIPFIGEPLGNALEDLAALFGLMNSRDGVQQSSADTANVGVAILNARINGLTGGDNYYDTFDRDTPPSTPAVDALGTDYTVMYDSGSGSMETRVANEGTTVWHEVGFADRTVWVRRDTHLTTTNNQRMSLVFNNFSGYGNANKPHIYMMGRWNSDATSMATSSFVMARIGDNVCEIGYVINGTYVRFGATVAVEHNTGDLWDFEVGTASDPWNFRLLQNNAIRVDRTDLGHLSMKDTVAGTLYQDSGFGADAGVYSAFPGHLAQIGPPDIQVLAGANTA